MKKGEKRMNREEFNQVIVESIQEHLGEGYKVSLSTNLKVNDVKKVAVKVDSEGCSISPLIYVDELYTQYERNESMEEVMNFVLELLFKQRITGPFDIRLFEDYERVKENIFPRLVNQDLNKEFLEDKIHREWLDLAIVYYFSFDLATNLGDFGINQDGEKIDGHITLIKEHLKIWGITEEELHEQALKNQRRIMQAQITNMSDLLIKEMFKKAEMEGLIESGYLTKEQVQSMATTLFSLDREKDLFYVLNNQNHYGAVEMYASDKVAEFAEEVESNIIILPSSSEEVLLMKEDDNEMSIERLSDMVKEVNETQVEKQQWLGNSIYRFNRERHEIEVISRG